MKKFFSLFAAVLFAGSMMAADATMAAGTNGSACTVNGVDGIKCGSSKAGGDMTITVGAGATKLSFYAAAWKGVTGLSLNLAADGVTFSPASVSLTADDGISNNTPFTLVGSPEDFKFEVELTGVTAETTIAVTASTTKRFVVWGASYEAGEGGDPVVGPTVLQAVSDSTTWDFSKITANTENALYVKEGIQLTDESEPSKNDEVIYADYSEDLMTIDEDFNKAAIAFKGEYPIRKNQYCQAGTLHFKADVAGTIVVKFSDTGTSASATAVPRYLVVNGVQTEYWTSRENNGETPYDAQLNVVSEKISVPAGDVTITGSSAITMYYVTFVPAQAVEPELPVYTCAQVQANEATETGELNEVQVLFVNGGQFYVRDATGMTLIYKSSHGLAVGNLVSGIVGTSTLYNNVTPQFQPSNAVTDWTITEGSAPVYDEKAVAPVTADVNGVYNFTNVVFAEAVEFTTSSKGTAVTATIGEGNITIFNNYKKAFSFEANKAYDVLGVVTIYQNNPQVYFVSAAEHTATAIDNTAVDAKAVKIVRDGQLFIKKGDVLYNALGAIVR